MIEYEEALRRILAALPQPVAEAVPLRHAHQRFLAEDLRSPIPVPPFDNSAMDGFAVRSADVAGASPSAPILLRVAGRIPAGSFPEVAITPGTCARIFTGSVIPPGADAVVMQEDTEDRGVTQVAVLDAVQSGGNIRRAGSDVAQGALLLSRGRKLTAASLNLLSAAGLSSVRVGRRPAAALLATGSELREPGTSLKPGQIYESNRAGLAALVHRAGGLATALPLVPDSLADTRAALAKALREADVLITSGGVSVGETDFVKTAWEAEGGSLDFWKVAIKPGKPFVFGRLGQKLLFGLPGNPVSAMVTFALLVGPALKRWQGATEVSPPSRPGLLAEPVHNHGDRRHFVRVTLGPDGTVRLAGAQGSHVISSLAVADGLLDLPAGTSLQAQASVRVLGLE